MTKDSRSETKAVKLVLDPPRDIASAYATNLLIQHSDTEFVVSFYEAMPPVLLGSPEERQAQLDEIGEVHARCVARIIVAPSRMQGFVNALQENLALYLERSGSKLK
jgi:hypothetical protein